MYKSLGKKFSGAATVTRVFLVGFKDFSKELGLWVKLKTKVWLGSEGVKGLTRKELDLYYRLPQELQRVGPTIVISALPFANYVMLPIAYYFPKYLLSSHFWSIQQKSEFSVEILQQKQKYWKPVLRILQSNICLIKDEQQKDIFQNALYKIGSGSQPTTDEILQLHDSFVYAPFSLLDAQSHHLKLLCRVHGIHSGWFWRRKRLTKTAEMIQILDFAILKDGISDMKIDELKSACFLRGFNASNTSEEDMNQYISQWISITTTIKPNAYSLILHLPIFLAYNSSNIWMLRI